MSQELHYTSAPRGLRPGCQGFCTVGCTPRMSGPMIDRLEALSGYQQVYPVHDPAADRNPINFSHFKLTIGAQSVSVLSRVGPAALNYLGRTNKYAHHVVLEAGERPQGGPAWLLGQPGFMQKTWEGEPRELPERPPVPRGDRDPGIARAWNDLTGDAGWAGVLAESFLADPKRPAILVFQPGMDLLPLFAEAIALLPPSRRWDVEFSTYFTTPPRGASCPWRGMIAGSPETESALRLPGALIINLSGPRRDAEGGELVHLARTGERPASRDAGTSESSPRVERRPTTASPNNLADAPPPPGRPPGPTATDPLFPELSDRTAGRPPRLRDHGRPAPRRPTWVLVAGVVAACLIPLAALAFFLRGGDAAPGPDSTTKTDATGAAGGVVQEEPKKKQETVALAPRTKAPDPIRDATAKPVNPDLDGSEATLTPPATVKPPDVPPPGATSADPPVFKPKIMEASIAGPPADKTTDLKPTPESPAVGKGGPVKGTDNKTRPTPPKPSSSDDELIFYALEEPATDSGDSDGARTKKMAPLAVSGAKIKQLDLIDLMAGDAGRRNKAALERRTRQGGIDILLNQQTKNGGPSSMTLAHFTITDGTARFDWVPEVKGEESKDSRNLLRNCVLRITTEDSRIHYAILREKPNTITGSLRIRTNTSTRNSRRTQVSFAPLSKDKRKPSWPVKWEKAGNYKELSKNLVITSLSMKGEGVESQDAKLQEGTAYYEYRGSPLMEVRLDAFTGEVRFQFNENPYNMAPEDAGVVEGFLNASYNVVISMKIENRTFEVARISEFASKDTPR